MPEPNQEGASYGGQAGSEHASAEQNATSGQVDIEKLADKVYHLMLEEIRLSRARGQPVGK